MNFLRVKPNDGETARLVSVSPNNDGVYVLTREWLGFWKAYFVDNRKTIIGGGWSHPNEAKEAAKAHARTR